MLAHLTRVVIAVSYMGLAWAAWWGAFRFSSRWGRETAARIAIAASLWGGFYLGVLLLEDSLNVEVAAYLSRLAHLPTLLAFGWVVYAEWRTERRTRVKLAKVDVE